MNGGRSLENFVRMVQRGVFVVLDTETTGLHRGEIVQIAVVDPLGNTLLNTLVKPAGSIPRDAQHIHGISDAMVQDAPPWAEISPLVEGLVRDNDVVVYNATYDRKMMHQSAEAAGLPHCDWKLFSRWWCAMEAFAEVYGDWNSYHSSFRWQKLATAASYYNIRVVDEHSALGDALMTLAVIQAMARDLSHA